MKREVPVSHDFKKHVLDRVYSGIAEVPVSHDFKKHVLDRVYSGIADNRLNLVVSRVLSLTYTSGK